MARSNDGLYNIRFRIVYEAGRGKSHEVFWFYRGSECEGGEEKELVETYAW